MSGEPARRTQAERRAESEERLLRASAELIVEQGLEGTSLAQIGSRAGSSHALVNHRFGSKDELVDRLVDEADRYYRRHAAGIIASRTGREAIVELARLYLDLVRDPDPLGRVHVVLWCDAVAHSARRRPAQLDWDHRFHRVVAGLIEDGIATGDIDPDTRIAETALAIIGALRGTAIQLMLDPDGTDLESAKDAASSLIVGVLSAPEA